MQDLFKQSELKSEKLRVVLDAEQELLEREQRCQETMEENIGLKKKLEKLKLEKTQESHCLKNLETANADLQNQLKAQK